MLEGEGQRKRGVRGRNLDEEDKKEARLVYFLLTVWIFKWHMQRTTILKYKCYKSSCPSFSGVGLSGFARRLLRQVQRWLCSWAVPGQSWAQCPQPAEQSCLDLSASCGSAWLWLHTANQHGPWLPVGHVEQTRWHFRDLLCPISFPGSVETRRNVFPLLTHIPLEV